MTRPRRVVLGTPALAVGTLVSLVCLALTLAFQSGGTWFLPMFLATLVWGAVPAAVLAFCCGAPLGILLHPVRSQWLHVAAFAGLGALLGLGIAMLISRPWSGDDHVVALKVRYALTLAGALAVGRLAVWRMARVNPAA
jgi:hypothetical protein